LQKGVIPLALEYVEEDLVEKSAEHLGERWPSNKGNAHLMIIVAGANEEEVYSQCEKISTISQENNSLDILIAESKKEQDSILKIRSNIDTAIKDKIADGLDTAVPPNSIGKLMDKIDEVAKKYNTNVPVYGHAGDGNLHPMILKEEGRNLEYVEKIKNEIYKISADLGGTLTAEHGIGKIRIKSLDFFLDKKEIKLMKKIKKAFDPNNILNPGKVLPQNNQRKRNR
jgi:glycolate oxidase